MNPLESLQILVDSKTKWDGGRSTHCKKASQKPLLGGKRMELKIGARRNKSQWREYREVPFGILLLIPEHIPNPIAHKLLAYRRRRSRESFILLTNRI